MSIMTKLEPRSGATYARTAIRARVAEITREFFIDRPEAHENALMDRTVEKLIYDYAVKHHNEWMLATAYRDEDKFRKIARGVAWEAAIICGLRDRVVDIIHFDPPIADKGGIETLIPTFMGQSCERCGEAFKKRDEVVEIIDKKSKERLIVHADSCWLKSDTVCHEVTKH